MNPAEHQLMLEMFKRQNQAFATLVEVLKSQRIVQAGDLEAYDELIAQSGFRQSALDSQVGAVYRGFATILGVETGLPLEGDDE